ncbi:MAG: DEAD/DEAH box helicase [Pirellulaceae bacterium]
MDQLPYEPYPVQEEALLAWFAAGQGVLVCAPTGTGKTLIAEAALFEALHTGRQAYYTTPLIALTDQKFDEMRQAAERWGFSADDVGLVTGNRRVNPDARILVVVAEILFNRLLHTERFDFSETASVVMDEFHSFNDPERGIVWELTLGLLPRHVRTLLLSATVGNAYEFTSWLRQRHERDLELVQSTDRKIPLTYHWVGDQLLSELLENMADGEEPNRRTPALVFCFNRDECWNTAELLKGKSLLYSGQQKELVAEMERYDWSEGAGPKLKQILMRGVGVHHAGVLPKYRRAVEDLFQRKLLSVCVCTETLAAGINLPARSVVIPNLLKGPPDKKRLIDPSSAHQMFGRAGRPQFDTEGHVYALAHEDDVKILRWREKYDQIPEDTKDPGLRKAKKALKKKMPTRRANQQYWTEQQFEKLRDAPSGNLSSRGAIPWRLLAHLLDASPEVDTIRALVGKRLLEGKRLESNLKMLEQMLLTLWRAGYVELEPHPPIGAEVDDEVAAKPQEANKAGGGLLSGVEGIQTESGKRKAEKEGGDDEAEGGGYRPRFAYPTDLLPRLSVFRSVNPLFGVFLVNQLGIADRTERLLAMEAVLEMPGTVARLVRVPKHDEMPPGPLAVTRLDPHLLQLGLATAEQLGAGSEDDEDDDAPRRGPRAFYEEDDRVWVLTLAEKLQLLFDFDFPGVQDVRTTPVWAAGELLEFGGHFNKYITSRGLQKQEGIVFRHLLRMILLVGEFRQLCPPDVSEDEWQDDLHDIADRLTEACRQVDPTSTDETLEQARRAAEGESLM